jgi:cyclophilin family peptidyl-prolyl cis-trans isomerase
MSRLHPISPFLVLTSLIAMAMSTPHGEASSNSFAGRGGVTGDTLSLSSATTAPTVLKQIPATLVPSGNKGAIINLSQYFSAAAAPTNLVMVNSSMGNFYIQLFPTNAPITVANFLEYVTNGYYNNIIIHRSVPGFVIQTGGYQDNDSLAAINTFPAITNEFGISNLQGTVAMALVGSNPDSATSQWFVNLTNNSSILDATNTAGNPPFTVFGQIVGNGMAVVDAIAALPIDDFTTLGFSDVFSTVPLQGWSEGGGVYLTNLVVITNVLTLPYFAISSDTTNFSAAIQGTHLVVKYLGTKNTPPLTTPYSVTAYAADTNGNIVQSTFQVSDRRLYQSIDFPPSYTVYSATNAANYILTNLPTASSGLPVTITIGGGPAKDFRIVTNQVVTMETNQLVSTNVYYVTNTITNNITFTNSITIYTTNTVTNSFTNSFTNSEISLTGAGNVALIAHQPGNAVYYPAPNEVGYVTVYKALQQITFPSITNQAPLITPASPTAPILPWNPPTASSGLPVLITVKSGPAKLNKANPATPVVLTGSGTVTLVATQNGNSGYYPAIPVTNTFDVTATGSSTNSIKPSK